MLLIRSKRALGIKVGRLSAPMSSCFRGHMCKDHEQNIIHHGTKELLFSEHYID